ncbi:ABC transporter permease [Faecalicatena acetigenes]|uniref:ABC transporter permease n=1 Tax=Faecalicatena acetigenes TaxID=2981790 RepID=A0ABT2T7I4_9FIRM|nr:MULTISPECIES: ABC transporter permease [Lachnospiraceae]MCU6746215.1 ABC transporter permease [Faecalicatena acetigenes]SCH01790.1 D-allose transport system permease protein AlsC [uncultured Clostridium sp.]
MKTWIKTRDKNTLSLFLLALAIFIIMGILSPKQFLGITNLQGMCVQFPEYGIMSIGMMICMMAGGIDLSLVGIANLTSILATVCMTSLPGATGIAIGLITALAAGGACGMINSVFIGILKIPPMLITLCGLQLYTGIGLAITKGPALTGLPTEISLITNGTIAGIPIILIIYIVVVVVMSYFLTQTIYGQELCFYGCNNKASRYSGIDNLKVIFKTYILSGILGSICGIIMISHYNSAKSDYGNTYTLLTLLIAVLGGTSPNGGKGKVSGVVMATLLLQIVSSSFNILRVNSYIKTFVWGMILIVVMVLGYLIHQKEETV